MREGYISVATWLFLQKPCVRTNSCFCNWVCLLQQELLSPVNIKVCSKHTNRSGSHMVCLLLFAWKTAAWESQIFPPVTLLVPAPAEVAEVDILWVCVCVYFKRISAFKQKGDILKLFILYFHFMLRFLPKAKDVDIRATSEALRSSNMNVWNSLNSWVPRDVKGFQLFHIKPQDGKLWKRKKSNGSPSTRKTLTCCCWIVKLLYCYLEAPCRSSLKTLSCQGVTKTSSKNNTT